MGVLQKLQTGTNLSITDLYDRGKIFCDYIHGLWPEGDPPPELSAAFQELKRMLAPERKDDSRTLTQGDFSFEPLLLCAFEKQPLEVQWRVVCAVKKASNTGRFVGMQKAERAAWFAGELSLAAANISCCPV